MLAPQMATAMLNTTEGLVFRSAGILPALSITILPCQPYALAAGFRSALSASEEKHLKKLFDEKIESKLDASRCYLAEPAVADEVMKALRHFDSVRYRLFALRVMPNHVHVLVRLQGDRQRSGVLHSCAVVFRETSQPATGIIRRILAARILCHLVRSEEEFYGSLNIFCGIQRRRVCEIGAGWERVRSGKRKRAGKMPAL